MFVWVFSFVLVDLLVVWLFGLGVLFWCLLFIFFFNGTVLGFLYAFLYLFLLSGSDKNIFCIPISLSVHV